MTVAVGQVVVARFPRDQIPVPAVAKVMGIRGKQALVRKRWVGRVYWAKPRWVPLEDVVRPATAREEALGYPVDPLPKRET